MPRSVLTFVALALLTVNSGTAGHTGSMTAKKTILVLMSERSDLPSIPAFEKGLREKLSEPTGATEFFVEYLDFGRFPKHRHETGLVQYLGDRYSGRHVDVVVPFQEAAFEFLLAHRSGLFPDVPVVAAGIERQHVEGRTLPSAVTTIPVIYNYGRTLELALALQPDAREVVIVHGVADYDLRRSEEARLSLERLAPRLSYRMLSGLPFPAIEDAVRNLPSSSIVLFLSMVRDAEGRSLVGQDYVSKLAAVSPVPIYGTFRSHLDRGSLGGAITDFAAIGRLTAAVVSQALSGQFPASQIVVELPETPLHINWRSLEKWRIPPSRVPGDAQILFREPGLWDAYRGFVLAALAAVLLQALLIAALLLQSRRRGRAEGKLRESEERLRMATDATHLGLWGWSSSSDRMWVSDGCRALYGLSREGEVSFRALTELVHPEDRNKLRQAIEEAMCEKRSFSTEYRVIGPEGEIRWIASQGRGSYGGAADPLAVTGVSADVTERKRAEETLRLAVEALPIAILMVNGHGTIMLANAQAEMLLGYQPQELAGQSVDILVPERFRMSHGGYRSDFFSAPRTRPMAANRDVLARRKNGSEIPVEIGLNPIRAREEVLVLAAIVDVTQRHELKRKQHELEHVARVSTMGEIAASLAHELSQPLSAILSNAQAGLRFINRGNPDLTEIRAILEDVVADDKRAGEVVGALRTMLRRGKTESVLVDASQASRDVLALLHSELVGQHIEVETAFEDCLVMGNKTQLEQVLLNLVMNAIDAMRSQPPAGRRLRISVSRTGRQTVQVAIRDSGIGIPSDELPRVFEAFWTTKPSGMGMGLAVCSTIVRAHGGEIGVEPNPSGGVTFVFTLPLAPEPLSESGTAAVGVDVT